MTCPRCIPASHPVTTGASCRFVTCGSRDYSIGALLTSQYADSSMSQCLLLSILVERLGEELAHNGEVVLLLSVGAKLCHYSHTRDTAPFVVCFYVDFG